MSWRLAKSLETFRNQVNVLYPNRSKVSDGTIGDAAHQAEVSDHNPDSNGVVAAIDITHDPAHGLDIQNLADELVASKDARIKYVITNRRIWTPTKAWQPYSGTSDPHTGHLHLSVNRVNYDDPSEWKLKEEVMASPSKEEVRSAAVQYGQTFTDAQVDYYASRPWDTLLNDLLAAVNAERVQYLHAIEELKNQAPKPLAPGVYEVK